MNFLKVSCAALAMASASVLAADGRILAYDGEVTVNGEPAAEGTELSNSDTISTGADSSVKIVLSDNSMLDLDGNTSITISEYIFDEEDTADNISDIDVLGGSLRYVSGRIGKDDPTDVSFSAGGSTIGIRGTYISIAVCPEEGCE